MSYLHALILGLIQGLSEFLPISSSAHLTIIPYIFRWNYQGMNFDIALHFGTVLALIIYFWHDWLKIIGSAINHDQRKADDQKYPRNLFWILLVATIPAGIVGALLDKTVEAAVRNPLLISILLATFGLVLFFADRLSKKINGIKTIGYKKGLIVGVAQCLALVPGVSRSGITTTAGLLLDLNRQAATRFAFLLATPTLFGAFLVALKDYQPGMFSLPAILAILISAVSGYLAIKFLLAFVQKHGYGWFAAYRILIAAVVVIFYFIR
ncbi:MAG: undecaprenyl-diphosphatase UppP [Candidatus Berkelbacteria bacterium]|nr:undecaprenyl-diphosphatase UppP [Candidatus Berkelbacteria bacterium]